MASFNLRNFGPVASADVDLKPLTIFIGPNNSGKSYLALAIYSISRALSGNSPFSLTRRRRSGIYPIFERPQRDRRRLRSLLREHRTSLDKFRSGDSRLSDMPAQIQDLITEHLNRMVRSATGAIEQELQRSYGTEISRLVRRGSQLSANEIEIGVRDSDSGLDWQMQAGQESLATTAWQPQLSKLHLGPRRGRSALPPFVVRDIDVFPELVTRMLFEGLLSGIAPLSLYLPASRTGILQGHKTLASFIVEKSSLAWIEPMDIPRLPGVVTDLIQALLVLGQPHKPVARIEKVVEALESNVTRGRVDIDLHRGEYPEINYANEAGEFQLHQVSSMVSEVAPMILFLKYLIDPGHLLIIEEPESHIEAATQRNLARAIAMLVNAGVRVLITTHSDYFLNQINNLILVSQISPRKRRSMGYKATEALDPADVTAYLFHPEIEGTRVDQMEISDYGIPTESFDEVNRALYDEVVDLQHAG